jgi:hypothetical protein
MFQIVDLMQMQMPAKKLDHFNILILQMIDFVHLICISGCTWIGHGDFPVIGHRAIGGSIFKAMISSLGKYWWSRCSTLDVSDDEDNEVEIKLNEHELKDLQKMNSIKYIELMRISPKEASCFDIPLYRTVSMPLVRPTLLSDIKRLEAEFSHSYCPGTSVFYVSLCNENNKERTVIDQDKQHWGPHWTMENEEFEAKLVANSHLSKLSGCMFFIYDGNHRFKAWTSYIKRLHNDELSWHYAVDNSRKIEVLFIAMHDI